MAEHGLTEESKDVCLLTDGDGLAWVQDLVKKKALAEAEAATEKEADEALRREESVVAEKRNAVEGAADEVAALAPKV